MKAVKGQGKAAMRAHQQWSAGQNTSTFLPTISFPKSGFGSGLGFGRFGAAATGSGASTGSDSGGGRDGGSLASTLPRRRAGP